MHAFHSALAFTISLNKQMMIQKTSKTTIFEDNDAPASIFLLQFPCRLIR
jgi:hypothetical protein